MQKDDRNTDQNSQEVGNDSLSEKILYLIHTKDYIYNMYVNYSVIKVTYQNKNITNIHDLPIPSPYLTKKRNHYHKFLVLRYVLLKKFVYHLCMLFLTKTLFHLLAFELHFLNGIMQHGHASCLVFFSLNSIIIF